VDRLDPAGLALDPQWDWQRTHGGAPPDPEALCFASCADFSCCTTDRIGFDVAVPPNDFICSIGAEHAIHGHVNWRAATYGGRLDFTELSSDFDYNFTLVPPDRRGLVVADAVPLEAIGVEFDARETAFHFTTPWWLEFNAAAVAGAARAMLQAIPGENGAVSGLLGLDCEHACATELHPAYAFVVHGRASPDDDVWPVFARNGGNEGFCSHEQHTLAVSALFARIPWRPGATAVAVVDGPGGTAFRANLPAPGATVRITAVRDDGVYVELPVASALDLVPPRIHGEVHLRWTGGSLAAAAPASAAGTAAELGPPEAEELLAGVYEALPDAVRTAIRTAVAGAPAPDVVPVPFTATAAASAPRPRRGEPATRTALAREKLAADVLQVELLCPAFGGAIPLAPALCGPLAAPGEDERDVEDDDGDARGRRRGR
jgi:hypothetical protein